MICIYFIGDKTAADNFKYEITPSLNADDKLILAQDVALNNIKDKGKLRCKLSYKFLNEEDGYDTHLHIHH